MIFFIFWVLGGVGICVSFYFHGKFLERLKTNHSKLYASLGEPTTFTKYPVSKHLIFKDLSPNKSATKYTVFMSDKEWEGLNDSELNKYSNYRRYMQYIIGSLFLIGVVGSEA